MEIKDLEIYYDMLQEKWGANELKSIYNGGCENNPDVYFVFMNPTGKNVASSPEWKGRRSPWIGTKNIWKLFNAIGLIDENIFNKTQELKPNDWTEEIADEVYQNVSDHKVFITNLGKCTQVDARPLPDSVYKEYLELLYKEIEILKPKKIITFGNQVSSIFLNQNICVSKCRKQKFQKKIGNETYDVYTSYYPIGNGMRNIDKAIEDINYILKGEENEKI